MKKKLISLLLCSMLACSVLTGCSGKSDAGTNADNETKTESEVEAETDEESEIFDEEEAEDSGKIFTADDMLAAMQYDIAPYVKLGDYTSIKVELNKDDYVITDENVEEEIGSYIIDYPYYKKSDRTVVEDEDVVKIDYEGEIEGEPFDGGSDEDYLLYIGMGDFIDGFESGLIGKKVGETVVLNLTFPEDYCGDDSINGKDVEFTVNIKEIEDIEEVTADTISDAYVAATMKDDLGVSTVEELKAYIKETLEEGVEDNKLMDTKNLIAEELVEISEVSIPDEMINAQILMYKEQVEDEANQEEMDFEEYLQEYYGVETWDDMASDMKDMVEEELTRSMVLDSMIKKLNISISEAEVEEMYGFYAQMYGFDNFDTFCELYGGKVTLAIGCAEEKVLDILAESADVVLK